MSARPAQSPASFLGSGLFRILAILLFLGTVASILLFAPGILSGSAVEVVMWSSGEKMTYLTEVVDRFNRERHTLPDSRRPIHVTVVQVNSGPMSDNVIARLRDGVDFPAGAPAPQIISPSVGSWLTRVNYETGIGVFDLEQTRPLARTPVVIAMYQEMAQALGWPQRSLGWSDIIELADRPEGWGAVPGARAEWGTKPLLAWTDPSVSSTARSALFAAYSAAAGVPAERLTEADLDRPEVQSYVRRLQGAVDHYFPETLKLQAKLFDGPRYIQFVPLEEYNLVWLKDGLISDGTSRKPLDRKMVAIYPKEGTVWHENPAGILQNVPWTSPDQQAAARVWVDYLLEPAQQALATDKGFRPANPAAPLGPKLSPEYGIDPSQPRTTLGTVDPAVAEGIVTRWATVKKPSVVVIVLDTSTSMSGDKLTQAKQGAEAFLDAMAENNYVGLVTFSTTVNTQIPIGPLASNKFRIAQAIERQNAAGSTALYDALQVAIRMADAYQVDGATIRGVALLSDGASTSGGQRLCDIVTLQDEQERAFPCPPNSQATSKEIHGVEPAVRTANHVALFNIGYGKDADLEAMRVLAEGTNGVSTTADPSNILRVFQVFGKYF